MCRALAAHSSYTCLSVSQIGRGHGNCMRRLWFNPGAAAVKPVPGCDGPMTSKAYIVSAIPRFETSCFGP